MVEQLRSLGRRFVSMLQSFWHWIDRAFPPLGQLGRFVAEVLRKFQRDDCLSYGAGLSFWLIVSLIPLGTLLFKLLVVFLGSKAYGAQLIRTLQTLIPYLPSEFIADSIHHSQKIGGLGFSWIVLLVGGYWGVDQLDTSLAHVFGIRIKKHRQTRRRHWLRRIGLLLGGFFFLLFFLVVVVGLALRERWLSGQSTLAAVLPPLLGLWLVTFVLQHIPRCHVRFEHAFLGAAVSTALWWLAKWIFGVYLGHTPTWGILYGSLGSIMAGLIFLYYSCVIFLLGAEITAAFYRHETGAIAVPSSLRSDKKP